MEKYLILKLDENSLLHVPERMSDTPLAFDPSVPEGELHQYNQVVLKGDGVDLKVLEDILFSSEFTMGNALHLLNKVNRALSNLENDRMAFDDPGKEGLDNQNSPEGIDLHSQDPLHPGSNS